MSDPGRVAALSPEERAVAEARARHSRGWTNPENWDGDEYVGPGLPPWGRRQRCPVSRNNRRCRKACIPGGTVCGTHGGAAPQVRRKAQLRLLSLIDPALGTLARTLAQSSDEALKVKIAFGILDRTGLGKAQDVSADVAKALMMERYYNLREQVEKEREDGGLQPLEADFNPALDDGDDGVYDAEVVYDTPPAAPRPPADPPLDFTDDGDDDIDADGFDFSAEEDEGWIVDPPYLGDDPDTEPAASAADPADPPAPAPDPATPGGETAGALAAYAADVAVDPPYLPPLPDPDDAYGPDTFSLDLTPDDERALGDAALRGLNMLSAADTSPAAPEAGIVDPRDDDDAPDLPTFPRPSRP